jgi:hypothetical protein
MNQVVLDVAAGVVVLELVAGDTSKAEGRVKLAKGPQSGVRGAGSAASLQADFGI